MMERIEMVVKGRRKILQKDVPGRPNREIRMWTLESKPGSTVEYLERAYLGALSAVDLAENFGSQLASDARFTDQGRQDQFKNHVIHEAIPVFHRGRRTILRAKQELADMRSRLQLPKADATDQVPRPLGSERAAVELVEREEAEFLLAIWRLVGSHQKAIR